MSVTLKLADEDAAVIGSILRAVGQDLPGLRSEDSAVRYENWHRAVKTSQGSRSNEKILELAGAFKVAVRANER